MSVWLSALSTAIDAGAVIVLAGMGELILQRSGVLNLGIEGMISIGAMSAVIAATEFSSPYASLTVAVLVGAVVGLAFGGAVVVARADQVLVGLAFAVGGIGLANEIGGSYSGTAITSVFRPVAIPLLSDIPQVGPALFEHDPLVYFAYLGLPALVAFFLFRTQAGLDLRAVGENPSAADATGTSVMLIRMGACVTAGALAGAGGAALSISFTPGWSPGVVAGRGWVSLAVVIFALWRPWRLVFGALLFGGMLSLSFIAQEQGWGVAPPVLNMMPYVVTLALIALPAFVPRWRRASLPPAALSTPYFREER